MSKINTCGHPDRPHLAKGKCRSCYYSPRARERASGFQESEVGQALELFNQATQRVKELRADLELAEVVEAHRKAALDAATARATEAGNKNLPHYFDRMIRRARLDMDPKWARGSDGEFPSGYWEEVERVLGEPVTRPPGLPEPTSEQTRFELETARWCAQNGQRIVGYTAAGFTFEAQTP